MALRIFGVILIALGLSACSSMTGKHGTFHNRTKDYLNAKTIPPMMVPQDVTAKGIESYYPVANPPQAGTLKKPVSIVPPDLKGKLKG